MTDGMIKKAFFGGFLSILAFVLSLLMMYSLPSLIFGYLAALFLLAGVFLILFGFLIPVAGRWIYHNIASDKVKRQIESFGVWRFLLNIGQTGSGRENDEE